MGDISKSGFSYRDIVLLSSPSLMLCPQWAVLQLPLHRPRQAGLCQVLSSHRLHKAASQQRSCNHSSMPAITLTLHGLCRSAYPATRDYSYGTRESQSLSGSGFRRHSSHAKRSVTFPISCQNFRSVRGELSQKLLLCFPEITSDRPAIPMVVR